MEWYIYNRFNQDTSKKSIRYNLFIADCSY